MSVDDVDASRRLAAAEHIGFALVSDADLTVARAYVGADTTTWPCPAWS